MAGPASTHSDDNHTKGLDSRSETSVTTDQATAVTATAPRPSPIQQQTFALATVNNVLSGGASAAAQPLGLSPMSKSSAAKVFGGDTTAVTTPLVRQSLNAIGGGAATNTIGLTAMTTTTTTSSSGTSGIAGISAATAGGMSMMGNMATNASTVGTSVGTATAARSNLLGSRQQQTQITGHHSTASVRESVSIGEGVILSSNVVEHEIKVPRKIVRCDIVEKVVVIPEQIVREDIVEETQVVREQVVEVAKPYKVEKIVEVPEVVYVDKIVEVPERVYKEKVVEKPVTVYQERVHQVPEIQYKEVPYDVLTEEIHEIPVEKIVEVVVPVEEFVYKEVPVPVYVDTPYPEYVDVQEIVDVRRTVPIPIEATTEIHFRLPKIRPTYTSVDVPVYMPRFVEVPIPVDALDHSTVMVAEAYSHQLDQFQSGSASLCALESVATTLRSTDFQQLISMTNRAEVIQTMWDREQFEIDRASLQRAFGQITVAGTSGSILNDTFATMLNRHTVAHSVVEEQTYLFDQGLSAASARNQEIKMAEVGEDTPRGGEPSVSTKSVVSAVSHSTNHVASQNRQTFGTVAVCGGIDWSGKTLVSGHVLLVSS